MKIPVKAGAMILCLCAAAGILFAVHNRQPEPESVQTAKPVYGFVDMETVVKAHPRYSEYFQLETEYNHMLDSYKSEQQHFISIATNQEKINRAIQSEAVAQADKDEYMSRVKVKEDELNRNLQNLYKKISDSHKTQQVSTGTLTGLSEADSNELANLQLRLTVLNLSSKEKAETMQRIGQLLNSRYESGDKESMQGWSKEEIEQMTSAKAKAMTELDTYAKSVAEEIKNRKTPSKVNMQAGVTGLPDADKWNAAWEKKIKAKQAQMAALKSDMMNDIRKDAAKVAQKKGLKMIFTRCVANVSGEDVTGDLVNTLISDSY